MTPMENNSINAIRILAADQVQKANSGHPGAPLGTAPMMYTLFTKHLRHNPANPDWENRDRFILSGGHGSAGYYALLHLFGYDISLDDLKNFRQLNSLTPGHPEYGHTIGVECTTGPLGSGIAAAVGMAIAQKHKAAQLNTEEYPVCDYRVFVEVGDGDLMEGVSQEALSMAGTLKLDNLILLYDSNRITIEGSTDLAFTENVGKRMESLGFKVWEVEDGNDIEAIDKALSEAEETKGTPCFIIVKTKIGYGSPKEGLASSHGEPLGVDNVKALREKLEWKLDEAFEVEQEVYDDFARNALKGAEAEAEWNKLFEAWKKDNPEKAVLWEQLKTQQPLGDIEDDEVIWQRPEKPEATRVSSGRILNRIKDYYPNMIGGSADLGPSNKTTMNGCGDFSADDRLGRNLHFGVREMAMAGIANGLSLSKLRPYVGTFFVFSDYAKPMVRLAALMKLPVTYVFSHDSIGVGEDGPTHQPVEHLASYRSIPNITVFRPADAIETAAGWCLAARSKDRPVVLVTSRQNLPQLEETSKEAMKGGYILKDSIKEVPDAIIMASGSEVALALLAQKALLEDENVDVRVVSMPSMEVFEDQPKAYKDMVLPKNVKARVAVEASKDFGWGRYTGIDGRIIGMNSFGTSAPGPLIFQYFGFTPEHVKQSVLEIIDELKNQD